MSLPPDLPFSFQQPSDEVMQRIAKLFARLPIHGEAAILKRKSRKERKLEHRSNGAELQRALRHVLDQDYAGNLAEATNAPYFFEYAVQLHKDDAEEEGLFVGTRLFAPDKGTGSIYYGSTIYRISDDSYLYWLSD